MYGDNNKTTNKDANFIRRLWHYKQAQCITVINMGEPGGIVVTHLPPTSEVCGSNNGPHMGQLVVAFQLPIVYSAESLLTCIHWCHLPFKHLDIVIIYILCVIRDVKLK